jgi:hypothetical protein
VDVQVRGERAGGAVLKFRGNKLDRFADNAAAGAASRYSRALSIARSAIASIRFRVSASATAQAALADFGTLKVRS